MRGFILLAIVAVASARPEAGYSYRAPGGHSGGHVGHSGGHVGHVGHAVSGGGASIGHGGGHSSHGSFGGSSSFGGGSSFGGSSSFGTSGAAHGGSGFGGGAISGGFGGGASAGGQTVVQKHIYVHVPPEEDEHVAAGHHHIPAAPAQKHYKIIFIKAPSAPSISQQIHAAQAQNQEKTLIYVLVKKPDDFSGAIDIPTAPAHTPSKPEVYFIKYKTQKGAAGGHSSGASAGGAVIGGGGFASGSGHASSGTSGFGDIGHAISSGSSSGIATGGTPASAYGAPGGGYHK